jgi:hypothetical protein
MHDAGNTKRIAVDAVINGSSVLSRRPILSQPKNAQIELDLRGRSYLARNGAEGRLYATVFDSADRKQHQEARDPTRRERAEHLVGARCFVTTGLPLRLLLLSDRALGRYEIQFSGPYAVQQ